MVSPWVMQFSTITGHAGIVVRRSKHVCAGREVSIRLIFGAELMNLIGFHFNY